MECCVCNRGIISNNLSATPIEPKGTPNRQWICDECNTKLPRSIQLSLAYTARLTIQPIPGKED
jgi:uncharacterized protein YlaI